jgi:DNA-binding MarR family transcriptional regulator
MKDLDPLLHNQLRLGIMALATQHESLSFSFIVDKTGASRGNVSVQITKLEQAGYVQVSKTFQGRKPLTSLNITEAGQAAMKHYTDALKSYLDL